MKDMVAALSALAQQTRLDVMMLLSRGPASGQTSGNLATLTQTPANSMSTHLKILLAAGLVTAERSGRQVFYRIDDGEAGELVKVLSYRLNVRIPGRPHDHGYGQWFAGVRLGEPVAIETGPDGGFKVGARTRVRGH